METTEPISEDTKKTCVLCSKESALAVFGVLLGLVFIAMSVDMVRRSRILAKQEGDTND